MSISKKINYIPYKVNKMIVLIYFPMILNKQKVLIVNYVLTLMYIFLCVQIIF